MPGSPPPPRLPPKKDVFLALLEQTSVFVHLDPRQEPVRVPEWFKKQPQLILQIGLNLAVPIRDLHVDDEGASCTLSFSRTPHLCFFPWPAVYALVGEDGRGMVWPDDVPAEVAAQQAGQARAAKKKKERPKLRAVGPADEAPEGTEDEPETSDDDRTTVPNEAAETTARDDADVTDEDDPVTTPAEPEQQGAETTSDERPKGRSLPPYLRVVK